MDVRCLEMGVLFVCWGGGWAVHTHMTCCFCESKGNERSYLFSYFVPCDITLNALSTDFPAER